MKLTPPFRQVIVLMSLALMIVVGTHWTYRHFNREWVVYHEGDQLFQKGDWQGATQAFEESMALGLEYPKAFLKLAKAYSRQKNFPLALHWYQRYLAAVPEDFWARKEYAGLLVATGKHDEAAEEYQKIMRSEKQP